MNYFFIKFTIGIFLLWLLFSFIIRLSFAYPSLILRLSFVTYSAAPARRLSFAQPSLGRIMNFELIGVRAAQEIRSVSSHYVFGVR